jgi:hypothetical protein
VGREATVTVFEVRSWAVTPDNQVVETTWAVRGMNSAERRALYDGVRDGRVSLDDLARMNAAGETAALQDARSR